MIVIPGTSKELDRITYDRGKLTVAKNILVICFDINLYSDKIIFVTGN